MVSLIRKKRRSDVRKVKNSDRKKAAPRRNYTNSVPIDHARNKTAFGKQNEQVCSVPIKKLQSSKSVTSNTPVEQLEDSREPKQRDKNQEKMAIHNNQDNGFVLCGEEMPKRTAEISLPVFRTVPPLIPIRASSRNLEAEILQKRHERLEAEEKMLIRQDRIWQNEQKRTARLLKTPKECEAVPNLKIIVHRKIRV